MLNPVIRPRRAQKLLKYSKYLSSKPAEDSVEKNENLPSVSTPKDVAKKKYDQKDITAKDMQWRTPWHEQQGFHYSWLRNFYTSDNQRSLLQALQTEIDLSPSAIKKWWAEKKEFKEIFMQQYVPERNQKLGNELAAAHFLVHRGGAIKFHNEDKWIKFEKYKYNSLPIHYDSTKVLQAIDCSEMNIYYEGLVNLRGLKNVEWLSFNGCEHIDDWCLDRISNIFSHSLIYLDLRDCPNITERGIGALYKMKKLKLLYLDDLLKDTRFEMTCLLLQEVNPSLDIRSEEY